MDISTHVTSRELSERLKELGVKTNSIFHWVMWHPNSLVLPGPSWEIRYTSELVDWKEDEYICLPAYLSSELGEIFSANFNEWSQGWDDSGCFWRFQYGGRGSGGMIEGCGQRWSDVESEDDREVENRGLMLEYLIKNGIIKL